MSEIVQLKKFVFIKTKYLLRCAVVVLSFSFSGIMLYDQNLI